MVLRLEPRLEADPQAIRRTLEYALAAISSSEPNADAGHEGLAQVPPLRLRQITVQPAGDATATTSGDPE